MSPLSPASAVDIAQTAADAVFQGARLAPVLEVIDVARRAERLVKQNFALSFGYNVLAVPLAILGYVTPLVAARRHVQQLAAGRAQLASPELAARRGG